MSEELFGEILWFATQKCIYLKAINTPRFLRTDIDVPSIMISGARCPIRKIFHQDLPRERYKCDAAIVWCFDNRFELALNKLIKRTGLLHPDRIRVAGGAKCLTGQDRETDRQFVLEQIQKSIRLHGTDTVFLMLHSDCGAYGGLAAFENDAAKEAEALRVELHRAMHFLETNIPDIQVRGIFADFEGVWEADIDSSKGMTA